MRGNLIRQLAEILIAFGGGRLSHFKASEEISFVAESMSRGEAVADTDVFSLAKSLAERGFFAAGHSFYRLGLERLRADLNGVETPNALALQIKCAIQDGDLEAALDFGDRLVSEIRGTRNLQFGRLLDYVNLWSGHRLEPGKNPRVFHKRLAGLLEGKHALILGPAPTEFQSETANSFPVVAQVLTPKNETQLAPLLKPADSLKIGYANGQTLTWLKDQSPGNFSKLMKDLASVVFKGSFPLRFRFQSKALLRSAALPDTFLSGNPNMVQIMATDIAAHSKMPVFVTGATFFLGGRAYRAGQARYYAGGSKNPTGVKLKYSRCVPCESLASHNLEENRALLRNLWRAGVVEGDRGFTRVLRMSSQEYLREIDLKYGEPMTPLDISRM